MVKGGANIGSTWSAQVAIDSWKCREVSSISSAQGPSMMAHDRSNDQLIGKAFISLPMRMSIGSLSQRRSYIRYSDVGSTWRIGQQSRSRDSDIALDR